MVKHGLLSPHSKLLPQQQFHLQQQQPLPPPSSYHAIISDGSGGNNTRPGSTSSLGSTITKTGTLKKDERNTPMRKERHRDGRLLRGGIGLTTGLGWSDRYVVAAASRHSSGVD